jgi:hypothetical protein
VKISKAFEIESETMAGQQFELPENVIGPGDSLQIGFVILSVQK